MSKETSEPQLDLLGEPIQEPVPAGGHNVKRDKTSAVDEHERSHRDFLTCWKSLETGPPFSSKTNPPCLRVDYTASVDKSSGLAPGSPFFAGFLVGDLRLDSLCRNRQESLPVSTMWQ